MQWEIVILVIFFIIILPLTFKIHFTFNALRNNGKLIVKLFFLPIYSQTIKVDNGFIKLIKNPKKIKKIKLSFKKADIDKTNNTINLLLNSQIIKHINIKTQFGIKNNPHYTALISGLYQSVLGIFFSINTTKRNIIKTESKLITYFKCTYLKVKVNLKIYCSLYEIISLIIQFKLGVRIT